jgi:hypothetical protein
VNRQVAKEEKGRMVFSCSENLALLATWRWKILHNKEEGWTAKPPRKRREERFSLALKTWRSWRLGGEIFFISVMKR